jgi:hypothetical protein
LNREQDKLRHSPHTARQKQLGLANLFDRLLARGPHRSKTGSRRRRGGADASQEVECELRTADEQLVRGRSRQPAAHVDPSDEPSIRDQVKPVERQKTPAVSLPPQRQRCSPENR